MEDRLQLVLLGGLQIEQHGTPRTDLAPHKGQALLCYLAVTRRPHSRAALAGLLWSELPEADARTNLRTVISKLHKIVGPYLSVTRATIAFNHTLPYWLDVEIFLDRLRRAQAAPDTRAVLREAVALYHGDFLAGFYIRGAAAFEEWALSERQFMRGLVVDALHRLAEACARQGDYAEAIGVLRKLLALEPWREEAHQQLIRLLALSGQRSAALNQYDVMRRQLEAELGVAPEAESLALVEQIRSGQLPIADRRSQIGEKPDPQPPVSNLHLWNQAPDLGSFYGRTAELLTLQRWLVADSCRVVSIYGMGGIGKTALAARLVEAVHEHFDQVIWRSLLNAPPLDDLLDTCIQALDPQQGVSVPTSLDTRLDLLMRLLRTRRCLLVLDNLESILEAGERAGNYRSGYADYAQLLARAGQSRHASCLLLTSREHPLGLERLEGADAPVRMLQLAGLDAEAGRSILRERGLGEQAVQSVLIERYSGNALALKLVAATIHDLFASNVAAFLRDETPIFDDIRDVLDQQFARLPALERELLVWLAIEREPTTLLVLHANLVQYAPHHALLEALRSLQRRSLLEQQGQGFTLQNVVMEYTTDLLVTQLVRELTTGALNLFARHALIKTQVREYVRQSQIRLILAPLAEQLTAQLGRADLLVKLRALPAALRARPTLAASYAAGNLLNLLLSLGDDLGGLDLSGLLVWQADLRGARTPDLNLSRAEIRAVTFTENMRAITQVACSPDGRLFAAGAIDGAVLLWDFAERRLIHTYTGHTALVNALAFSPDGALLASGASDETIRLWDLAGAPVARVIQAHAGGVIALDISSRGMLASSGYDGAIRIWDVATAQLHHTYQEHAPLTLTVAWSPDGATLVSGGYDSAIRLWDAAMGTSRCILQGHSGIVPKVVYNRDGRLIASGGSDRTVRVWDAHNGLQLHALEGHTNVVTALAFSPDSGMLASGAWDQMVRLWDLSTGRLVAPVAGHTSHVSSLAFSPDGATLISGGYDQTIRLWDGHTQQLLITLRGHTTWVWALAFSPDGAILASAHHDQAVRLWDTSRRTSQATLYGHVNEVTAVAISPDGTTLASAGNDRKVRLWDMSTGQIIRVLAGHSAAVYQARYSPDGHQLATGDLDGAVWLWDLREEQHRCLRHGQRHSAAPVAWGRQPGGELLLATPTDECGIQLWDAQAGAPLRVLRGHSAIITAIALGIQSPLLASGSWDRTVRLWDLSMGQVTSILRGHTNYVMTVAISPDEVTVVSGGLDGTVRLWDTATGTERHTLLGHTGGIFAVAFSPDGATLASGSDDETIRLWDVQAGACLAVLRADGPYAGMQITGAVGLSEVQRATLKVLGAVDC